MVLLVFKNGLLSNKRADISYALFPESWGKGYAKGAVNRVLSFGFQEMDVMRIGAIVFTEK